MSIQEALKLLRLELGLTQEDFAKKIDKTFLSVNRWENGKSFPSRNNARRILELAHEGNVSENCIAYLNEMLLPNSKRIVSTTSMGFENVDHDFLLKVMDTSSFTLYIVEAVTYKLLYANQKAQIEAVRYLNEIGMSVSERRIAKQTDRRCFHYFANRNEPCPFCPLEQIDDRGYKDILISPPESERKIIVHAKKDNMNGKDVYIIYLTDITQVEEDKKILYELTNDIPAGVGIYNLYLDDKIELVYMNQTLFRVLGEERGRRLRMNGSVDTCLVHPKDKIRLKDEIHEAIAQKRELCMDMRMCVSNNEYHLMHIEGKILKVDREKISFYCVFRDLGFAEV